MTHTVLTIDFETDDKYLKTYGMGWAFKLHFPEHPFTVLGVAYLTEDGEKGYLSLCIEQSSLSVVEENLYTLEGLLNSHDALLCHNSTYDIGCLLSMVKTHTLTYDIRTHYKYDSMLIAKLSNQNFFSYGLDNLAKIYLKQEKKSDLLHDFAWSTGIYQANIKKTRRINVQTRPSEAVMESWCKTHMSVFPVEVMSEYAIGDVVLARQLFDKILPRISWADLDMYSDLQNIVIDCKSRGVYVDLARLHEVSAEFKTKEEETLSVVYGLAGKEFNLNSSPQLAEVLFEAGYKLPLTEKGNYSAKAEVLENLEGDIIDAILRYKKVNKVSKDYIAKVIASQDRVPESFKKDGMGIIFPTMKILGAKATGRFTSGGGSGCKEVNIQVIPGKDEEFGKPCRSFLLPYPGEKWGYGDFSSQESRLQVHYAKLLNCDGVDSIIDDWNANPTMSFHDKVSEMASIERPLAKVINLGLSYGMGTEKLILSLKMGYSKGKAVLKQYHQMLPFMKQLSKKTSEALKVNGYIKTIEDSRLRIGRQKGAEKDGLNRLIQGSGASQCKKAMQLAWQSNIKLLFCVHDELNFSSANIDEDMWQVQSCMEGAHTLVVPVVAEMGQGDNWLQAKENAG